MQKFRGEIPKFLKEQNENIVYLCSSNKNIDDYFYVLRDIYDGLVLKFEIEGNEDEFKKINYEILNLKNSKQKYIILISTNIIMSDFFAKTDNVTLKINGIININKIKNMLNEKGYESSYIIEKKRQYSHRGDIFDIYTDAMNEPTRIEFFGDEIDRITSFDIETQKSIEKKDFIQIQLEDETDKVSFLDLMYSNKNNFKLFLENRELINYKIEKYILDNYERENILRERKDKILIDAEEIEIKNFSEEDLKKYEYVEEVKKISHNYNITIYSEEEKRYREIFSGYPINFVKYPLFEGYKNGKELVLTDRELKGVRVKKEKISKERLKYKNVAQLKENDYIIHENYGVGIYLGLENIDGKEYIKIKYADEDKLFVPIDGISKIEKYINASGEIPEIYNLGTRGFKRKKQKLKEDMMIFAKEIIELQARREMGNGFSFSKDTVWQEEFEDSFPYQETPTQKQAIEDVKRDMESPKIMDRLICGDVGYGKTEVAIRAAFKAIIDNKQVVMLVPTTILAEQHYERFTERFKNYPITVEVLSRVKSDAEQKKTIQKIFNGTSDMLIGTHRILSDDIKFKNLGLIIIDEEQKFGVKHKEKLKKLKYGVDVLTMTATPIPRTLNMSLLGIRDMSIIDSPPAGRQKIETAFIEDDAEKIRDIVMEEIAREGQVFYIFNNVKNIENKTRDIKNILPSYIKVDFIHGQLPAKDIKRRITDFENGNIDVLVATTIIENGIDIENANTMIIDGADKIGLAQIYQLRGRIGRSNKKSYCYLIKKENIGKKAKMREESIINFADAGGLQLSMEDMRIRGAGEILGEKQHGAIETFGYNLYMKMLNDEIEKLRGNITEEVREITLKLKFEKYIPDEYIARDEKLNIYKRALLIDKTEEVLELAKEIEDRFGKMPAPVQGFIKYIYIKNICRELNILEIDEIAENEYKIFFDIDSVDLDKILEMIENNTIKYLHLEQAILYSGDIFNFFNLYTNKKY